MDLVQIANYYRTDKVSHGFAYFYQNILSDHAHKITSLLELGILKGSSLLSWNKYFKNAMIYGIDKQSIDLQNNNIRTFVARQQDPIKINEIIEEINDLDIIIDDASHCVDHQQQSLALLFKHVKSNGYYIIEDLHTSTDFYINSNNYNINIDKTNTTLQMIFNYITTNKIVSEYIDADTSKYIESNIQQCYLYHNNHNNRCSITVILHKR